jgi:hypothetical protein
MLGVEVMSQEIMLCTFTFVVIEHVYKTDVEAVERANHVATHAEDQLLDTNHHVASF